MAPLTVMVDFWDVGQGDATVIHLSPQSIAIIDCGPKGSKLPQWLDKEGFHVEALLLTHMDADHAGALPNLLEQMGNRVHKWAFPQDRSAKELRSIVAWIKKGIDLNKWKGPHRLEVDPDRPRDLFDGIVPETMKDRVQLKLIRPLFLENLRDQATRPNEASAVLVLFVDDKACVAWPGDLPMEVCIELMGTLNPTFLVGPHHGAPKGSDQVESSDLKEAGHKQVWISVGTKNDYDHPNRTYLTNSVGQGITIRCSQLTERCDRFPDRHGAGILNTHHSLGLIRPNTGVSCMGPMRVRFRADGKVTYNVEYSAEHDRGIDRVQKPCCR